MTRVALFRALRLLCAGRGFLAIEINVDRVTFVRARWILPNPRAIEEEVYMGVGDGEAAAYRALLADVRARLGYSEEPTRGAVTIPNARSMLARRPE